MRFQGYRPGVIDRRCFIEPGTRPHQYAGVMSPAKDVNIRVNPNGVT